VVALMNAEDRNAVSVMALTRRADKPAASRVSPEELQAAARIFARALHEHLADGLATGQLETVLSGARCLEHLAGLAGPTVSVEAFAAACQEPDRGA
jgi:hypothetical protein